MTRGAFGSIPDMMPESFYDLLAYVVPASLFSLGLARVLGWNPVAGAAFGMPDSSIVVDVFMGFVMFGAMYFVGQVATSISFYIVAVPVRWGSSRQGCKSYGV